MSALTGVGIAAGSMQVSICGPVDGAMVEVLDLNTDEHRIVGGTQPDENGDGIVDLTEPLRLGHVYGTTNSFLGAPHGPYFSPAHRRGHAEDLTTGVSVESLPLDLPMQAFVDNAAFAVPLQIRCWPGANMQLPRRTPVFLSLSCSGEIANPPGSSRQVLVPDATIGASILLSSQNNGGVHTVPLPLADAELAGTEIYFQWMLGSGADFVLSDIVGMQIRASQFPPPSPPPIEAAQAKESRRTWLETAGATIHDHASTAAWMKLRGLSRSGNKR